MSTAAARQSGGGGVEDLRARFERAMGDGRAVDAEAWCARALELAAKGRRWGDVAGIVPMLSSASGLRRRQALESGDVTVLHDPRRLPRVLQTGCYLVQPPMIGRDGANLRHTLRSRRIAGLIVTREPMTRTTRRWPIVAVTSQRVLRVQVDPPRAAAWTGERPTYDQLIEPIPPEWFAAAARALDEAAVKVAQQDDPAAWQADDLVDAVLGHPEAVTAASMLVEVALRAASEPEPRGIRRGPLDNPFSF